METLIALLIITGALAWMLALLMLLFVFLTGRVTVKKSKDEEGFTNITLMYAPRSLIDNTEEDGT